MADDDTTLEEVEQQLSTVDTEPEGLRLGNHLFVDAPEIAPPTTNDEPDRHLMGPVQAHVTDREDLRITRTYCPVLPDLPEQATTRAAELEPRPEPEPVPGLEIPSGPLLFEPR